MYIECETLNSQKREYRTCTKDVKLSTLKSGYREHVQRIWNSQLSKGGIENMYKGYETLSTPRGGTKDVKISTFKKISNNIKLSTFKREDKGC